MAEKALAGTPIASSEAVRRRMSDQRQRDTAPELMLRAALHASGRRYRVHYPVPGSPRRSIDIAFPGKRVAVFVDGCFWHGCPVHGHAVVTNGDWWDRKILRNRERDCETNELLADVGWVVVRIWEHEDVDTALRLVISAIDGSN